MAWFKHILTGKDNETVAIGRVLGLIVFALFIVTVPIIAVVTLRAGSVSGADWKAVFEAMQVYVPAILLSVAGLIGITSASEPPKGGE